MDQIEARRPGTEVLPFSWGPLGRPRGAGPKKPRQNQACAIDDVAEALAAMMGFTRRDANPPAAGAGGGNGRSRTRSRNRNRNRKGDQRQSQRAAPTAAPEEPRRGRSRGRNNNTKSKNADAPAVHTRTEAHDLVTAPGWLVSVCPHWLANTCTAEKCPYPHFAYGFTLGSANERRLTMAQAYGVRQGDHDPRPPPRVTAAAPSRELMKLDTFLTEKVLGLEIAIAQFFLDLYKQWHAAYIRLFGAKKAAVERVAKTLVDVFHVVLCENPSCTHACPPARMLEHTNHTTEATMERLRRMPASLPEGVGLAAVRACIAAEVRRAEAAATLSSAKKDDDDVTGLDRPPQLPRR